MNVSQIDIPGASLNGRLPACEPTGLVLMRLVYSRDALCIACMKLRNVSVVFPLEFLTCFLRASINNTSLKVTRYSFLKRIWKFSI